MSGVFCIVENATRRPPRPRSSQFGGAFYPTNRLPDWAQVLAQFIPLTHVVEINRGLIEGEMHWSHLGNFAVVLGLAAAFFALALWSMRRRLVE